MDYYRNNKVFKYLLLFTNGRQEFDPQRVNNAGQCVNRVLITCDKIGRVCIICKTIVVIHSCVFPTVPVLATQLMDQLLAAASLKCLFCLLTLV